MRRKTNACFRFSREHGINCCTVFSALTVNFVSQQKHPSECNRTAFCIERQILRTTEIKYTEKLPVGGSNNLCLH